MTMLNWDDPVAAFSDAPKTPANEEVSNPLTE